MSVVERAAKLLQEIRKATVEPFVPGGSTEGTNRISNVTFAATQDGKPYPSEGLVTPDSRIPRLAKQRARSTQIEIDVERLGRLGMVTPLDQKSRVAEEYRAIKRPLLRNVAGKGAAPIADANLIMITSALPGEGKSTTSVNLAISIAMELDHRVLLVDADVSKPSIPAILGIPAERGLLDLLIDDTLDVSDVLLRTNVDKLSLLPSGAGQLQATELLSSAAMSRLLKEMSGRYSDRIIVFDSPPLLSSNEARALATLMGQIVVVVGAESTTHAALKQALAAIETCPIKLLMLNKSRVSAGTGYGNYGTYGYGYGSKSA